MTLEVIGVCVCLTGVRDSDEGPGQKRPISAPAELSPGGAAGRDVEEVHPVGEEQPTAHRGPDTHH